MNTYCDFKIMQAAYETYKAWRDAYCLTSAYYRLRFIVKCARVYAGEHRVNIDAVSLYRYIQQRGK